MNVCGGAEACGGSLNWIVLRINSFKFLFSAPSDNWEEDAKGKAIVYIQLYLSYYICLLSILFSIIDHHCILSLKCYNYKYAVLPLYLGSVSNIVSIMLEKKQTSGL